jgi:hypothetical protein
VKRIFLSVLFSVLSACATTPGESKDGGVSVVWNRVDEPHRVCESLSGRKAFFNILGCSHWEEPAARGAARVCSIYAPAPRSEGDLQRFATLGHELMHCFDGNWHDKWGRMTTPPTAAAGGTSQPKN